MASKEHPLLTRAAEQFPDLTDAEKTLLHAVIAGKDAAYRSPNDAENDPQHADTWEASRTIRAKVIRWLCVDREAILHIDPHGINIDAATIEGQLDLAFVILPVPLFLARCAVKDGVNLVFADTRTLLFSGSVLGASSGSALDTTGAQVHGGVFLNDGFRADGTVRLYGALIDSTLDCKAGTFHHPEGDALIADQLQVRGAAYLNDSFRAAGTVRLLGASIDGDLDCGRAAFHRPEGNALIVDGAQVHGAVFLNDGFRADGTVRLLGASIDGDLVCKAGTFHRPAGNALHADRVQVGGNVYLDGGFRADGTVRLLGASIGGNLECRTGTFHRPAGNALHADRVQVGGSAFLDDGFRADGTVRLVGGRVGLLLDDEASWPAPGHLRLDGFVYTAIAAGPTNAKARLHWLKRQPQSPFKPQPYLQLAKVLRESGHEADAKQVLIAKERARRKYGGLGWGAWCWSWLLGVTMAHGYQPGRLLLGALFFVLLGGVLFAAGYHSGQMIPAHAEAYNIAKEDQASGLYPTFDPWMYSLDTLIPLINFGQKDYWRPLDPRATPVPLLPSLAPSAEVGSRPFFQAAVPTWVTRGEFLRVYRWVHIGVGWLLITLGVAGVTSLVRKE